MAGWLTGLICCFFCNYRYSQIVNNKYTAYPSGQIDYRLSDDKLDPKAKTPTWHLMVSPAGLHEHRLDLMEACMY